jgi:hypothetical protein
MSPFLGFAKMNLSFRYAGSLLSLVLAITGTTMMMAGGSSGSIISQQAWADLFPGTGEPDTIVGTPGDDQIDSKGGEMMKILEIRNLVMVLEMT